MDAPTGREQHEYNEAHNSLVNALSRLEQAIDASNQAMYQRLSLGHAALSGQELAALNDLDAAADALTHAKREWERVNDKTE